MAEAPGGKARRTAAALHNAAPEDASLPAGRKNSRLTVLSGPSGVGKSTVVAELRRRSPEVWISVSVTTRRPRPREVDGREYHFVGSAEFDRMISAGELLEWAEFAGNKYGTPAEPVRKRLEQGQPTLLEIDLAGARQVRDAMKDNALFVFLKPPSWGELVRRLSGRGLRVVTETEIQISGLQRRSSATTVLFPTPEGPESTVSREFLRSAGTLPPPGGASAAAPVPPVLPADAAAMPSHPCRTPGEPTNCVRDPHRTPAQARRAGWRRARARGATRRCRAAP